VLLYLLKNVVRNWYARNPEIVDTENRLVSNAWDCAAAFERGKYSSYRGDVGGISASICAALNDISMPFQSLEWYSKG